MVPSWQFNFKHYHSCIQLMYTIPFISLTQCPSGKLVHSQSPTEDACWRAILCESAMLYIKEKPPKIHVTVYTADVIYITGYMVEFGTHENNNIVLYQTDMIRSPSFWRQDQNKQIDLWNRTEWWLLWSELFRYELKQSLIETNVAPYVDPSLYAHCLMSSF